MRRVSLFALAPLIALMAFAAPQETSGRRFDERGYYCDATQATATPTTITWAFWGPIPRSLLYSYSEMIAAMVGAAEEWSNHTGVKIERLSSPSASSADVLIRWDVLASETENNAFYERAQAFATYAQHPRFPCMPRMIVLQSLGEREYNSATKQFDYPGRVWSVSDDVPAAALDVQTTVLHEWGHVLFGPGHVCGAMTCVGDVSAVMDARQPSGLKRRRLTPRDLQWARENTGGLIRD